MFRLILKLKWRWQKQSLRFGGHTEFMKSTESLKVSNNISGSEVIDITDTLETNVSPDTILNSENKIKDTITDRLELIEVVISPKKLESNSRTRENIHPPNTKILICYSLKV